MTKPFSIFTLALTCIAFTSTDCKHTPTGPNNPAFALTVEDASCTEAWLKLSVTNMTNPAVVLKRDSTVLDTLLLTTADTTIVDENLLPSHTYTYTAQLLNSSTTVNSTAQVQARTMDTTSHSFSFTTTVLGDGSSSSTFNDVAIINDTLAYAVGSIYQGGSVYNLAKWNGSNWQLIQLYYNGNNLIVPIRGISYFGSNDVWLSAGGVFHWDGVSSQAQLSFSRLTLPDPNATVEKLWGTSSSSLYGVGNSGTIVHYNGSSWSKIESGVSEDIQDIYGYNNATTGQSTVLCVSSTVDYGGTENILTLTNTSVTKIATNDLPWSIRGVWLADNSYYVVGSGMFHKRMLRDTAWQRFDQGLTPNYVEAIRGNARNDIAAVGDYGTVLHYNGVTWNNYTQQINLPGSILYAVSIQHNQIIAVGMLGNSQALILMGTR
jgi:hypothetical protein